MGNGCCRPEEQLAPAAEELQPDQRDPRWIREMFDPLGPESILAYFTARPNIFLFGDTGSGKTSLFLRLVFPELSPEDAISIVSETRTLHCETWELWNRACNLWDMAGEAAMMRCQLEALSTMFVRGIIWVVSMLEVNRDKIIQQRRCIQEVIDRPEMQSCFFVLLFNTCDLFADEESPYNLTSQGRQVLRFLTRTFGVSSFTQAHPMRFTWTVVNCKAGWTDPRFDQIARFAFAFLAQN